MNDIEKRGVIADCIRLFQSGADTEALLRFMRERGLFENDSLEALAEVTGMSEKDALVAFNRSDTWAGSQRAMKEVFFQALEELSKENDPELPKIEIARDDEEA